MTQKKIIIAGGLLLAAAVVGIVATNIWLSSDSKKNSLPARPIISDMFISGLSKPEEATKDQPALAQRSTYRTGEPLALRATTYDSIEAPYQLSFRLLRENGQTAPFSPATIELNPGVDTYCCWVIPEAGVYTLQVFRPEGVTTALPLTIVQAIRGGGALQKVELPSP